MEVWWPYIDHKKIENDRYIFSGNDNSFLELEAYSYSRFNS